MSRYLTAYPGRCRKRRGVELLQIYTKAEKARYTVCSDSGPAGLQGAPFILLHDFAFLWALFGATCSTKWAWGVRSCFLAVCESWWGSDGCLMCVLSCRRPHAQAPTPCAKTAGSPKLYLRPTLWVKLLRRFMISHVWPDSSLTGLVINRPSGKCRVISDSYISNHTRGLIYMFNYPNAVRGNTTRRAGKIGHLAVVTACSTWLFYSFQAMTMRWLTPAC